MNLNKLFHNKKKNQKKSQIRKETRCLIVKPCKTRSKSRTLSIIDSPQEINRSRSNSVSNFETSGFQLGEPVFATVGGAFWEKAVIRDVNPLKAVIQKTGQAVTNIGAIMKAKTTDFTV